MNTTYYICKVKIADDTEIFYEDEIASGLSHGDARKLTLELIEARTSFEVFRVTPGRARHELVFCHATVSEF